jgi:hypothetical protein
VRVWRIHFIVLETARIKQRDTGDESDSSPASRLIAPGILDVLNPVEPDSSWKAFQHFSAIGLRDKLFETCPAEVETNHRRPMCRGAGINNEKARW